MPFGSEAYYLSDGHMKYEGRGRPGAVIGYADHNAYLVLDVEACVQARVVRIVTTRDVRLDRTRVALRAVEFDDSETCAQWPGRPDGQDGHDVQKTHGHPPLHGMRQDRNQCSGDLPCLPHRCEARKWSSWT